MSHIITVILLVEALNPSIHTVSPLIVNQDELCNISTVSSSIVYGVNSSYGPSPAQSTEPLDIFDGKVVIFKGINENGSATLFNFLIECDLNINITAIFMASAAHLGDTLFLLGSNQNVIWSYGLSGGDSYNEWYWTDITGAFGTTFYLKETNGDITWRWRQNITIYADLYSKTPTKEPTGYPTNNPTAPTSPPTLLPSTVPSTQPTKLPSTVPSSCPTDDPTTIPSEIPSNHPSSHPSFEPTFILPPESSSLVVDVDVLNPNASSVGVIDGT